MILTILPLTLLWCSPSLKCRDCAVYFIRIDSINLTQTFCQFLTLLTGPCWRFFTCCTLYQEDLSLCGKLPQKFKTELKPLTPLHSLDDAGHQVTSLPGVDLWHWLPIILIFTYLLLTPQSSLRTGGISYTLVAPWESHLFHAYGS